MLKSEAINQAYSQLTISGLTSVATSEDTTLALYEMDQMMWEWASIGRDVNYNFPAPTNEYQRVVSDPSDELNVFDWAITGFISSLACRLVEYFGMEVPDRLNRKRAAGIRVIQQKTVKRTKVQYPSRMPIGSGNRVGLANMQTFYHPTYTSGDHSTVKLSQIMDLTQDFTKLFPEGVIQGQLDYTITANPEGGVRILSDSIDGYVISYRIEAYRERSSQIDFVVTNNDGLVVPLTVCFDVVLPSCQT